ncbi:MAG: energy-coupling factor transporter transmembrane protein EcfT [Treponema sp.]|jgi:biotin transport system permease protein|nr:energy-coupling factor transporter transmembrane protein EcfT [Treponema sp.]
MAGTLKPALRSPFSYRAGTTALHRTPAALKLLAVLALSTAAFSSVPGLALAILLTLAASAAARIPPWELLKGAGPLAVLSLCIIFLNLHLPHISVDGLVAGIIAVLRIFVPFAAAALLFAVTTMRELRLSLAALEMRIQKALFAGHTHRKTVSFFSLGLCLMLGFIPRFFEVWETANLACEARSCRRGLRRLFILIPLVCERMMESAVDTALALQARGLGYGE